MKTLRIVFLLLLAAMLPAAAQLNVVAKLERNNFVAGEAVPVVISVTNTSGRDAVIGGQGNGSWLSFTLTGPGGQIMPPLHAVQLEPIRIRNGETIQRRFDLRKYYFIDDPGNLTFRASAYYPDLDRFISSKSVRVNVFRPRQSFWEQTVTVGGRDSGAFRRYALFTFQDTDRMWLYLRVTDEKTKLALFTIPLSSMLPDRNAQPAVDADQNLHVLYLGSPTVWVYMVLDTDGNVSKQIYYRNKGERPQLFADAGRVTVVGGTVYDPVAEKETKKDPFRRLSDRPPGLPSGR